VIDDFGQRPRTQPPVLDEAGLASFLTSQPDIAAAYLFGSLAEGRATPRSDVDIAVLLSHAPDAPGAATERRLQLMDDLRRFADRHVDVLILNNAQPYLQDQVLRKGRLIHQNDRQARIEFEVRSGKIYADLKPMYDFHTRDLLSKIREVGLGRRRRHHREPVEAAG
jgi:predicted nucleotidyltransferase